MYIDLFATIIARDNVQKLLTAIRAFLVACIRIDLVVGLDVGVHGTVELLEVDRMTNISGMFAWTSVLGAAILLAIRVLAIADLAHVWHVHVLKNILPHLIHDVG